ncbi:hypothetical protein RhiirC2_772283 [Rhizophagus irregularis]|uniref:Uncharacterized protein n=1 Tax=Rhizophagus irregularis TaxID=588596 RepID=A0A2N1NRU8_9GLOM|nr:hypothetical protein RhiirC2_772283 [Rhizophagus irregularis]
MSQKECEKQYQYRLNGSGSGESEQESFNFEQNSKQKEFSDSDQSSSDMPKSFKEALRREVFWIIKRIPTKEISKTNTEDPNRKHKIAVKKLNWRSSTLQLFLRSFIDRLFTETSKEQTAPFYASKWTIGNYQEYLKVKVEKKGVWSGQRDE